MFLRLGKVVWRGFSLTCSPGMLAATLKEAVTVTHQAPDADRAIQPCPNLGNAPVSWIGHVKAMNCIGCGFVIQAEFAFCPKCGARQPARCASCGYACPPDFAFCPKCGQKQGATPQPIETPPAAPWPSASPEPFRPVPVVPLPPIPAVTGAADRRTVTGLFADLSGFTTL